MKKCPNCYSDNINENVIEAKNLGYFLIVLVLIGGFLNVKDALNNSAGIDWEQLKNMMIGVPIIVAILYFSFRSYKFRNYYCNNCKRKF